MNYRHIYMVIITKAKMEMEKGLRAKKNGNYYENHHILPRSLFPLWTDKTSNQVLLTAREHYFCHKLLVKIFRCKEMATALFMMSTSKVNNHLIISSRDYEYSKKLYVELNDFCHPMKSGVFHWFNNGENEVFSFECPTGYMMGRIPNSDSRIKAGKTNRERNKIRGSAQSRMTIEQYKLWRQHLSEAHMDGKEVYESMPEEIKNERARKISESLKGHKVDGEAISKGILNSPKHKAAVEKIAAKHRGKKFFNNGEICILAETCPDGFVSGMLKRQGSHKNLKEKP